MNDTSISFPAYDVPLILRVRDVKGSPNDPEGLTTMSQQLRYDSLTGRGFLRVQVGLDICYKSFQSTEEINSNFMYEITKSFYEPQGTHSYKEVVFATLFLSK